MWLRIRRPIRGVKYGAPGRMSMGEAGARRSVPKLDRLKFFLKSVAWTRLELPRSSDFRATIGLASTHGSAPAAVLDAGLRRLGEPSPAREDRVSPRGEAFSSRAAWRQTPTVHRRSATAPCSTRSSDRTARAGGDRHARWSRYAVSLVPRARRNEVRQQQEARSPRAARSLNSSRRGSPSELDITSIRGRRAARSFTALCAGGVRWSECPVPKPGKFEAPGSEIGPARAHVPRVRSDSEGCPASSLAIRDFTGETSSQQTGSTAIQPAAPGGSPIGSPRRTRTGDCGFLDQKCLDGGGARCVVVAPIVDVGGDGFDDVDPTPE